MKKFLMLVLSFIMLIGMMIPVASAISTTKVTVSVTSNSYSYSYSSSSFSSTSTSWSSEDQHCASIPWAVPTQVQTISTKDWTELTQNLEPLYAKIKELSALHEMHQKMINDFINGKWDGKLGPNSSTCYLDNRTYHWGKYDSKVGDWVNDADVNIDYVGSLCVIPGVSYTLAVDYDTGRIEEWQLGELKDYWILQFDGEQITGVQVSLESENQTYIGNVLTTDKNKNTHFYTLKPGGLVIKEF